MKQTDGLFHQVFQEVAKDYPNIENEHLIIDIGAAKLADTPALFDVIVTPNLYGDVVSDIAAQIAGSVGLAGSSNIGESCAMFEAIHGSAPTIAGQNIANPSGLLNGAVMMLNHLGQTKVAWKIQNAWLKTIEEGLHTFDIYQEGLSKRKLGTKQFAQAVIANLGSQPSLLKPASFTENSALMLPKYVRKAPKSKALNGVDVFVHWNGDNPDLLADKLLKLTGDEMELTMITNRGIKVWPNGFDETFCTDHWRCRFQLKAGQLIDHLHIVGLLQRAFQAKIDVIKTENLYVFDGKMAYSLGQGQ